MIDDHEANYRLDSKKKKNHRSIDQKLDSNLVQPNPAFLRESLENRNNVSCPADI